MRRVERLYTDRLKLHGQRWDIIYYKVGDWSIWRLVVYRGNIEDAEKE